METKVFTDASNFAAGIFIESENIEVNIPWAQDDAIARDWIFMKEAWAVLHTMKTYGHLFENKTVHFMNDNRVVERAFYVGSPNPALNRIIREIHELGEKHNTQLLITWVSTADQKADWASRQTDVKEAVVRKEVFQQIQKSLNWEFDLDLFATDTNTVCEKYCSMKREQNAWARDAFVVKDFGELTIWAFPPQVLVCQAFHRLRTHAKKNKWALLIMEYEMVNPIKVEVARRPEYSFHQILEKDPVLFPAKKKHEVYGYYKVPKETTFWLLIHDPNLSVDKVTNMLSSA